jgi:uncharacterized Zn finger protein
MEPLDGNAVAGALYEHFGHEMTTAWGECGYCGNRGQIAELRVYARAPGPVARCQKCGKVAIVFVTIHDSADVRINRYKLLDTPAA